MPITIPSQIAVHCKGVHSWSVCLILHKNKGVFIINGRGAGKMRWVSKEFLKGRELSGLIILVRLSNETFRSYIQVSITLK